MFLGSEDDDGSGFSIGMPSSSGSNLSSLFVSERKPPGGNESLKYTAPKQPRLKDEEVKTADLKTDAPSLIHACACHAYKLIDGKYQSQGKLGAALLGNFSANTYKILLYISQKKPVTTAIINPSFKFNVQKNNYATFYDDQQQNWSLCFDTESGLVDYAKWIGLAIFNVSKSFVMQNLNVVDGQEVCKGDTVEMQYTGWLHTANTFGKVFDSNKESGKLFKFKVGKGKVIKGWDTGVIGMKKSSKGLLVIPPDQAYGNKSVGERVPPNATLIFQIEVTRVKFVNPLSEDDTVSLKSVHVDESIDVSTEESRAQQSLSSDDMSTKINRSDSFKDRTKSISEQLSKAPENSKSKLLERMSRMGQPVMASPQLQKSLSEENDWSVEGKSSQPITISSQVSNTETDFKPESPKPSLKPKPETAPRPIVISHASDQQHPVLQSNYPPSLQSAQPQLGPFPNVVPAQQISLYQPPNIYGNAMQQPIPPQMGGIYGTQPTHSGMSSTEMNLMMTDSRLKHTEVKTDLSRLLEKVDSLSSIVNKLETKQDHQVVASSQHQQLMMSSNAPVEMEAVVIMHNVSRIIKENEKLRIDCDEKTKKIELLNDRMTDLLTKNQLYFEKSNQLLANQSDSLQNNATQALVKVNTLEQQKVALETEISSSRTELAFLKSKEEENNKVTADFMIKIEKLQKELKQVKDNAELAGDSSTEHENMIEDLKKKLKDEKKEQKKMKLAFEQMEEDNAELKLEKDSFTKTINDLKKKRKNDIQKYEEEQEDIRMQHDSELKKLHQRYKKDGSNENETLEKLENDLNIKSELKLKTTVERLTQKHDTDIEELKSEKEKMELNYKEMINNMESALNEGRDADSSENTKLQETIDQLNKQLSEAKNTLNDSNIQLQEIKHQLDETKSKYTETESQLVEAKNQLLQVNKQPDSELNGKLEELLLQLSESDKENQRLQKKHDAAYDQGVEEGRATMKTLSNASYERGLEEGRKSVDLNNDSVDKSVVASEVKKVMNTVFFQLKNEFKTSEEYRGEDVVVVILNTIKAITIKMMNDSTEQEESGSEEESDDDEEEENSDEEELDKDDEDEDVRPNEVKEVDTMIESPSSSITPVETLSTVTALGSPATPETPLTHVTVQNEEEEEKDTESNSNENCSFEVVNNGKVDKEIDPELNRKNTLESVGLDSSMFETDNVTTEKNESETMNNVDLFISNHDDTAPPAIISDESALFFGSTKGETVDGPTDPVKKLDSKSETSKVGSDLFGDSDEDSDLFTSKSNTDPVSSAFDRSPPPLFGDDDDDTNWI